MTKTVIKITVFVQNGDAITAEEKNGESIPALVKDGDNVTVDKGNAEAIMTVDVKNGEVARIAEVDARGHFTVNDKSGDSPARHVTDPCRQYPSPLPSDAVRRGLWFFYTIRRLTCHHVSDPSLRRFSSTR
ncbi:unnamed protein product [Linum trigynum]|uniref:Uncharacterized protein n=1 Tax=Linum trigynum TaxID=586398 RepID=A0AAV2G5X6_9ROSI